ncbi:hypothetical protein GCM10028778_17530 [Barrientosiimonas marina]|uniref:Uncharacterized protein n=1 Tax=Lentibacillus kimchii TaxID=1542911 RepID=A0ABW2UU43_9BACI
MESVSIQALKALVETKIDSKTLMKVIWNNQEKLTLFIKPNISIHSVIYDKRDGYLFYDPDGKRVTQTIPLIVPEDHLADGKVLLGGGLLLNDHPLSKEDIAFLQNHPLS